MLERVTLIHEISEDICIDSVDRNFIWEWFEILTYAWEMTRSFDW